MCILFVYINNDATAEEYQVIVAMNRDEFLDRPTLPAHFWNDHCIGGTDALPGREGGTWFGASSKFSKIGSLLNISEPVLDTSKCPRGHLVTDFLQSDSDALAYIDSLRQREFSPFNLVLLECRDGDWSIHYFCNKDDKSPRKLDAAGVHVFGNSVIEQPWQKVVRGRAVFDEIVTRYRHKRSSEELKADLIEMLADRSSNMPDPVLESQLSGKLTDMSAVAHKIGPDFLVRRSAVFVDLHDALRYGTRTHTLLLVDKGGHCEYVEKTMNSGADRTDSSTDLNVEKKRPTDWTTTLVEFGFGSSSI